MECLCLFAFELRFRNWDIVFKALYLVTDDSFGKSCSYIVWIKRSVFKCVISKKISCSKPNISITKTKLYSMSTSQMCDYRNHIDLIIKNLQFLVNMLEKVETGSFFCWERRHVLYRNWWTLRHTNMAASSFIICRVYSVLKVIWLLYTRTNYVLVCNIWFR